MRESGANAKSETERSNPAVTARPALGPRPGRARQAVDGVDPPPLLPDAVAQRAPVGREARRVVGGEPRGERSRLAALPRELVEVRVRRRVRGVRAVRARHDHERAAVGRPLGLQVVARALSPGAAEAALRGELRSREQVARGRACVRGDREHVRRGLVEPLVPPADGERLVGAHAGLRLLARGGERAVRLEVRRAGPDRALVRDPPAVRAPLRRARGERRRREPLRLATAGDVEDVDLCDLVVVPLRREGDPPAVGAPRRRRSRRPGPR